jgi:hypothetical protein
MKNGRGRRRKMYLKCVSHRHSLSNMVLISKSNSKFKIFLTLWCRLSVNININDRRELKSWASQSHLTDHQQLLILERRTKLLCSITAWSAFQASYMPEVLIARAKGDDTFAFEASAHVSGKSTSGIFSSRY